jgi:MFS family permease
MSTEQNPYSPPRAAVADRPGPQPVAQLVTTCGLALLLTGYGWQVMSAAIPAMLVGTAGARVDAGSASIAGYLALAFPLALGAGGIGAALLAPFGDRRARRALVIAALLTAGVAMLAASMAPTLGALLLWEVVTGAALGVALPYCNAWVSECAPRRHRAMLLVLVNAAGVVGAMLGAGVIGPPLMRLGGWPVAVGVGGCLSIAVAALAGLTPREPRRHWRLRRGWLRRYAILLRPGLRRRTVLLGGIVLANFLILRLVYVKLSLMAAQGMLSPLTFAMDVMAMQVGGVLGGLLLAACLGRGRTRPALLTAFAITAVFLVIFELKPVPLVAAVIGLSAYGTRLTVNALVADFYPAATWSTAFGWLSAVGQLISVSVQLVAVWFMWPQAAATSALSVLTVGLVLLCACLAVFLVRQKAASLT